MAKTKQELKAAAELLEREIGGVADWHKHGYRPTIRSNPKTGGRADGRELIAALEALGLAWHNGDTGTPRGGKVQSVKACYRVAKLLGQPWATDVAALTGGAVAQ